MKKIFVLCLIAVLTIPLFVAGSLSIIAQAHDNVTIIDGDDFITVSEAKIAAMYYVKQYSTEKVNITKVNHGQQVVCEEPFAIDWQNAEVGEPVTYYSIDNAPIAYEFIVSRNRMDLGFLIISATRNHEPLWEVSIGGKAPSEYLTYTRDLALNKGIIELSDMSKPVIYYFGALSYYVQFGPTMKNMGTILHLPTGSIHNMPDGNTVINNNVDKYEVDAEWEKINTSVEEQDTIDGTLVGVPAWWQSTASSDDCDEKCTTIPTTPWPTCAGNPDDPWDNWDGCGPISGAMIFAYWDYDYPAFPVYPDEILIDDCHHYMQTQSDGWTSTTNLQNGISQIADYYDASYNFTSSTVSTTWSAITTEIDNERPFILLSDPYPGENFSHFVACVGYETSPNRVVVHNTWDNGSHLVNYSDLSNSSITKVFPG